MTAGSSVDGRPEAGWGPVPAPSEPDRVADPVGAIVGAKIVDDTFARAVSKRTGAAVGFYADGARVASGSPEGFDKANLDEITRDLKGNEEGWKSLAREIGAVAPRGV